MHYFFVFDENKFIERCHVCNEAEYTRYLDCPEDKLEVSKEAFDYASSFCGGRIKYLEGGDIQFFPDDSNFEIVKSRVDLERNQKLATSDWTQLPDVTLATKDKWAEYRQALRDITDQQGYPFEVVWPEQP